MCIAVLLVVVRLLVVVTVSRQFQGQQRLQFAEEEEGAYLLRSFPYGGTPAPHVSDVEPTFCSVFKLFRRRVTSNESRLVFDGCGLGQPPYLQKSFSELTPFFVGLSWLGPSKRPPPRLVPR